MTEIHSVDKDYLKDDVLTATKDGVRRLYGACAVNQIIGPAGPVVGYVGNRVGPAMRFLNTYGDQLTHHLLPSQWSIADSSVAAFDADAFRGLKLGQTIVTATRGNKSGNALLQFINPVPPRIFGTWTGSWEGTNTSRSGSLSVTISGNQFSWIARATWTADGVTYAGASDSGEEQSALSDDPALSTGSIHSSRAINFRRRCRTVTSSPASSDCKRQRPTGMSLLGTPSTGSPTATALIRKSGRFI